MTSDEKKSKIYELEKMLNSGVEQDIRILPDGSITTRPHSECFDCSNLKAKIEDLKQQVERYRAAAEQMCAAFRGFFLTHDPRLPQYAPLSLALDVLSDAASHTERPVEERRPREHRDGKTCLCDFDKNVCPLHGVGTEKRVEDSIRPDMPGEPFQSGADDLR